MAGLGSLRTLGDRSSWTGGGRSPANQTRRHQYSFDVLLLRRVNRLLIWNSTLRINRKPSVFVGSLGMRRQLLAQWRLTRFLLSTCIPTSFQSLAILMTC